MNARILVIAIAVVAVLGLLRYRPWQGTVGGRAETVARESLGRETLTVGFLPVT